MTYQDLIEELQGYSPEELKQNVILYDIQSDDECSLEEIDSLTAYNQNHQLVLFV